MEKIDIEKMSNIDLSQDSVKSISDKCNELKSLRKEIEDEEKIVKLFQKCEWDKIDLGYPKSNSGKNN